jgi:hypothetical protein
VKRDRVERNRLRLRQYGPHRCNKLGELRANVFLNEGLMVRNMANLASRRRIGIVVVPEASGSREEKHDNRDASGDLPAALPLQCDA